MNKKVLSIGLIAVMLIVSVVLIIIMMTSGEKETYFGYMKNSNTADKVINEKDHKIEENVKLPSKDGFSPKEGDFVRLVKSSKSDKYTKMQVVSHDDVPHGLMMKIHDMSEMKH